MYGAIPIATPSDSHPLRLAVYREKSIEQMSRPGMINFDILSLMVKVLEHH